MPDQKCHLTKQTALTEKGEMVNGRGDTPNRHDILTGSTPDGRALPRRFLSVVAGVEALDSYPVDTRRRVMEHRGTLRSRVACG